MENMKILVWYVLHKKITQQMFQSRKTARREIIYLSTFIYLENDETLFLKTSHSDPSFLPNIASDRFQCSVNVQKTDMDRWSKTINLS